MSVSSVIEIQFAGSDNYFHEVLENLFTAGWTIDFEGTCTFLPLNDNGNFNWISQDSGSWPTILSQLNQKENNQELIGLQLIYQDSKAGGLFLFYPDNILSVQLSINRRGFAAMPRITDISWYIERIIIPLVIKGMRIESITWSEQQ